MTSKIFISHNHTDKIIVEPIAIRLSEIFGQDKVFYDSWSIQPGQSIIERMNDGMSAPDYVFFFLSENSLASGLVTLEWQTALLKASKGLTKLIPVRLDSSDIPELLKTTLYLDMFNNGLESTLAQIVSVAQGQATFSPQLTQFSNLTCDVNKSTNGDAISITITANHFVETDLDFIVLSNNVESEMNLVPNSGGTYMMSSGYQEGFKLDNGKKYNAFMIKPMNVTLKPGFPLRLKFSRKSKDVQIHFRAIMHQKKENYWEAIPCTVNN